MNVEADEWYKSGWLEVETLHLHVFQTTNTYVACVQAKWCDVCARMTNIRTSTLRASRQDEQLCLCDNNLDNTAVGNILLFLLLLLSFNFIFTIQAMLAGCPLASWCLNAVVVAAILPTVLELDKKIYQRLDSVQLRGARTFNINNADISFIVCFDVVLFTVVFYSKTHLLIYHFFYFNYQNPPLFPFQFISKCTWSPIITFQFHYISYNNHRNSTLTQILF